MEDDLHSSTRKANFYVQNELEEMQLYEDLAKASKKKSEAAISPKIAN